MTAKTCVSQVIIPLDGCPRFTVVLSCVGRPCEGPILRRNPANCLSLFVTEIILNHSSSDSVIVTAEEMFKLLKSAAFYDSINVRTWLFEISWLM
jgi:hypothetical protein